MLFRIRNVCFTARIRTFTPLCVILIYFILFAIIIIIMSEVNIYFNAQVPLKCYSPYVTYVLQHVYALLLHHVSF